MLGLDRNLPRVLVTMLAVVAVVGYAIGHSAWQRAGSPPATRSRLVASVLLQYPEDWRQASIPPALAELKIAHPVVLSPPGRAGRAGLLAGSLPPDGASLLPQHLLSALGAPPRAAIVNLLELQAYRYKGLSVPGFEGQLTMFLIPNRGEAPATVICYANARAAHFMSDCNAVVAGLTQVGQSYELTPDPGYARRLRSVIDALDASRLRLAGPPPAGASAALAGRIVTQAASQFKSAADALSALEPPAVSSSSQVALLAALTRASRAYASLSALVRSEAAAGYGAARSRARAAEAEVDSALSNFALLGYL
jgi:hypothetical protein